jgi:hypothetical protein
MGRNTAFMCVECKRTRLESIHIHKNSLCTDCHNKQLAEANAEKRAMLIANRALVALPSIIQKIGESPLGAGTLVTQIAHIIADNYKDTPMLSEMFLEAYKERVDRHNRRHQA